MKQIIPLMPLRLWSIDARNMQLSMCGCVLFFSMFLSSCVSYKNTSRIGAVADSKVALISNVADVDVDFKTKITAISAKTWCVAEAKEQAYYRAVVNNNIDILVDPIYEVKTRGKRSIASVTGYAGHYKNVRTVKEENQLVFEQNLKNAQTTYDQSMAMLEKKMAELDKFSKIDAVAKEELKTYLIIPGSCGTGGGGGATEKELNTNISIVEKYNSLSSGGSSPAAAAATGTTPAVTPIPVQSGPSVMTKAMPSKKKK